MDEHQNIDVIFSNTNRVAVCCFCLVNTSGMTGWEVLDPGWWTHWLEVPCITSTILITRGLYLTHRTPETKSVTEYQFSSEKLKLRMYGEWTRDTVGSTSDSYCGGRGFETHQKNHLSLSKKLYPKCLVLSFPGTNSSVISQSN